MPQLLPQARDAESRHSVPMPGGDVVRAPASADALPRLGSNRDAGEVALQGFQGWIFTLVGFLSLESPVVIRVITHDQESSSFPGEPPSTPGNPLNPLLTRGSYGVPHG